MARPPQVLSVIFLWAPGGEEKSLKNKVAVNSSFFTIHFISYL